MTKKVDENKAKKTSERSDAKQGAKKKSGTGKSEIKALTDRAQHTIEEAELGHKPAQPVKINFSSKITTLSDSKQSIAPVSTNQGTTQHPQEAAAVNMGAGKASNQQVPGNLTPQQLAQLQAMHKAQQNQKANSLMNKALEQLVQYSDVAINYMTVPTNDPNRSEVVNYTRSSAIFGIWVSIITLVIFFIWGGYAPINKAAYATGSLVLESQKRIIQHPYGGVIDKVYVREGDFVNKGQVLISLNKVDAKAEREDAFNKYITILAENARLTAQRDDAKKITFPEEILSNSSNEKVSKIIGSQDKIFYSRMDTMTSDINIEENKIHQLSENKRAYVEIVAAIEQRIENFKKDLEAYKAVGKVGAASPAQIRQVENQLGQALNEKVETTAKVNQMDDEILREQSIIANIKSKYLQETSKELRANMQDLVTAKEHFLRADDRLIRSEIRAPVAGYVSNLQKIYTDGGVLQQVQPILEIIPQDDVLVADVQINANDIDIVHKGQTAHVMILPFKNRVVPKIKGTLISVSADAISVPASEKSPGFAFYNGRIEMDPKELEDVKKTKGVKLYPGMPVQAFIEIGPRTLLRYLLDPFLMSFDRAFREE